MSRIIRFRDNRLDEIVKQIKDFGLKKITVMFDEVNYLFTDYPLDESMNAKMAVENQSGEVIYIDRCNCGYGGNGPGNTESILLELGLHEKLVSKLKYANGFVLQFDEDGELLEEEIQYSLPFDSRITNNTSNNIFIDSNKILFNLSKRQIYFIYPTGEAFRSLLRTIDILTIDRLHYYIGKDNSGVFDFSFPYKPDVLNRAGNKVINGPFFYLEANPFNIIVLTGNENAYSFINMIYYYLSGKFLFSESKLGQLNLLSQEPIRDEAFGKWKKLFQIIYEMTQPEKEIQGSVNVIKEQPEKWRI